MLELHASKSLNRRFNAVGKRKMLSETLELVANEVVVAAIVQLIEQDCERRAKGEGYVLRDCLHRWLKSRLSDVAVERKIKALENQFP